MAELKPALVQGLKVTVLLVVYLSAAKLGLRFDALGGVASTVWPPAGIALAALVLHGYGLWPAIALGAFLANYQAGMPMATAAIMAAGNTLEAVVGTYLLRQAGFRPAVDRLRDVFLLVLATLISTTISATGGVLGLIVGGIHVTQGLARVWSVWWLGDVMGDLLVAPLLLTWTTAQGAARLRKKYIEVVLLGLLLAAATLLVFAGVLQAQYTELLRQSHVIFPLLIWVAFRFGPQGATAAVFIASALAVGCTAAGVGPFVRATRHESLLFLQSYLMVEVVTVLTLAAAIAERRRAVMARDEFISIASHELKTPITALKLRLNLLSRMLYQAAGIPAASRDELGRGLDRAELQVDRLTRLVDDLLDVSRLVGGRFVLTVESVALSDLVRDVLERLGEELVEAGCPVELQLDEGIAGKWDRLRLEQVLTNLLTNAIKYAPGSGIKISAEARGGQATLVVADQGMGISREQQRRIFEPFERGGSSPGVGGLGLGLFIVRQIVNAHRGDISVDSEAGQGATFRIVLPCESQSPQRDRLRSVPAGSPPDPRAAGTSK